MATGMLPADPYASNVGGGLPADPFTSAPAAGLSGMAPSLSGLAALGQSFAPAPQFEVPQLQQPTSQVYISPSKNQFYVQGVSFSTDDEQALVDSQKLMGRDAVPPPTGGDWTPVDPQAYSQLIANIQNPSLGRLASRNFGRGVDSLQMLAGRGLQLAGAEQTGGSIVAQQETDLAKTSPYERKFTDIDSGRGAVEWFVANLAQQGPNLIESVATALAGAAAGTLAAGPGVGTAVGTLAGLAGRKAFKDKVLDAAEKYAAGGLTKDSAEYAVLKNASALAGAVTTSFAQNIATGASDIYGELREQGAGADDTSARLKALAGSVPYALLETLPEYLLASRVLGGTGARAALPGAKTSTRVTPGGTTTVTTGPTRTARGVELLKRGAIGGGVGGTLEGLTETGQESLLMGISGQDLSDPENVNRLINSFAAGFGVGGPIGAAANLRSKQPENILKPGSKTDLSKSSTVGADGKQLEMFGAPPVVDLMGPQVGPTEGALADQADTRRTLLDQKAQLTSYLSDAQQELTSMASGNATLDQERITGLTRTIENARTALQQIDQQLGQMPAGGVPIQQQGQLGLFQQPSSVQQVLGERRVGQQAQDIVQQQTIGQQLPLQDFINQQQNIGVPPTPAIGTEWAGRLIGSDQQVVSPMNNQLLEIQSRLRRQQEFEAAEAQRAALQDQERERLAQQSRNARDIFDAQREIDMAAAQVSSTPSQQTDAPMPMRPSGPTQPQQLPLFPRRELPVPSRAEGLRRGVGTQIEPMAGEQAAAPRGRQLPLFTQEGQPSVAALKSAGTRQKVPAPVPATGGTQAPPTGRPVNAVTAAKARAGEQEKASPARGLKKQAGVVKTEGKKDAVQKPSAAKVPARKQPEAGKGVGGKVPRKQGPAGKGEALKAKAVKAKVQDKRSAVQDVEVKPAAKAATLKRGTAKEEVTPPKKVVAAPAAPVKVEALPPADAWEDMKPEGAPVFAALPPAMQSTWTRMVERNRASGAEADVIAESYAEMAVDTEVDTTTTTPAEALADAIATADSVTDNAAFKEAIQTVLKYAFFAGEDTNVKKLVDQARGFLNTTDFSTEHKAAMDEAFLGLAQNEIKLEAAYKSTTKNNQKGDLKPWFSYAVNRGLLPSIKAKITNMPEQYKTQTDPITGTVTKSKPVETSVDAAAQTPEAQLGQLIEDLVSKVREYAKLTQPINFNGASYDNIVSLATELYAATNKLGREYIVRGYKLKDYFKADGSPKMLKSAGRYVFTTTELTAAEQRRLEQEQREAAKIIAQQQNAEAVAEFEREQMEKDAARPSYTKNAIDQAADNINEDYDSTDGMFYRADGTPDSKTIPAGRVRLLVRNFVNKLRAKPNTTIFANVADLKQRNPELYRRAAAARKEGDFDTTNAVGYSFGDNVIIFTDFVRTEQQLKFVLAHEALGHFGFRGVIPKKDLDAVLNRIYDLDSGVQAAVEAMMSVRGMSKLEAIEEYLADNAAELDTSLIAQMWNVLKNFLNKLGFEFRDDEARYFVNLARKYVRRGDTGNFVNARSIMNGLESIARDEADGRYARVIAGDMGDKLVSVGSSNRNRGNTSGVLDAVNAFAKDAFGKRRDVPGTVSRILESVQTLSNKARRSYGLNEVFRMITEQQQKARAYLSKYERMTRFTHSAKVFGYGQGVEESQKETAGELLARAALLRSAATTPAQLRSFGPLVTVDAMGNITLDKDVRDKLEIAGFVTAEEFRKGFDVTYTDGSTARFQYDVDDSFTLDDDGTKIYTDPVWRVYVESRKVSNEAAIDMMLANYEAAVVETKRAINGLNDRRSGTNVFTEEDLDAIRKAADLYRDKSFAGSTVAGSATDLNKASKEDAEKFMIAFGRALFDDAVFAVWNKDANVNPDIAKDMKEFMAAEYDDLRAALPSLRAKIKSKEESFTAQKAMRDSFLFSVMRKDAELYAKNSILSSYVKFARRGTEQVRLTAVDADGNPVALDENVRSALPYFIFESRNEALESAKLLDAEFGGDNEFVLLDEDGNETTVKLVAEVSRTRQTPDLTSSVNFNEFVYLLNRLNVNLAPEVRERIITTLTQQNARARSNLQRSGTEGWDKNIIRSLSEHLQTTAHVAAKKLYNHRLDDVMLNKDNWLGDDTKLAALKDAVDTAQTDGARARAQRAYDEYAYMYRYMKATSEGRTVNIGGKDVPTLGRGEDYRGDAQKLITWLSETTDISNSTEDMLSGEAGSMLKLATVLMQLGGSVASAVVNLASIVTNTMPYLSYYNSKNGFGGGYGQTKAATAIWKAASDVKNRKFGDAAFLDELLSDGSYEQYGLTEAEAQFLFNQTERGFLDASQYNALVGTASGKVFSNKAQAGIQAWMSMFAYTEQLNRRTSALATYRLEADRLRAEGVTDENQIAKEATDAARKAVIRSQGEYAMFDRPEMARGNVLSYVFMYKQFVIVTVQLLKAMPPKGQLLMLGMLLLASGLKGLPFAEDIFDIVDTISQKLGLKMGSVEKEITEWLDAVAPGMTPYLMRGVMDRMTGATVSTRLGMGNLVPLTGVFKAGADPARELADFAGPVFSGISGIVGMAGSFAKYGAETVGLRDDVTTISGILRDSPIAAARAFTDGLSYMDTGMITNNRGQVVSKEAPYHTIIARMLGFYPAIATQQNDIVRMSKSVGDYAKAIKADYVSAYVKAGISKDNDRMRSIVADVQEWNADAKGTGLEVSKFTQSANRALKEAQRPTVLRYLKSAPKQMRPETMELLRILGVDEGDL